jgi:hypothetical protein
VNLGVRSVYGATVAIHEQVFRPLISALAKGHQTLSEEPGQVEKNGLGQTVYRGYQAALAQVFRTYIDEGAFAHLVAKFRK